MENNELIELLNELAEKDLAEGADLFDHPCSVAIRELTRLTGDKLMRFDPQTGIK